MMTAMAAVDLGASSGRVILGVLDGERLELSEVARFGNGPVAVPERGRVRLHWDVLRLWSEVMGALRMLGRQGPVTSVGIDTWAVDYGLLDVHGALLGNPAAYRCDRTRGVAELFSASIPADELYAMVGMQRLPFNTLFQLVVEERLDLADSLLLLPDLLGYWLTGVSVAEVTNASTTGLLDPRTRRWHPGVIRALIDDFGRDVSALLPRLVEPGDVLGPVSIPDLGLVSEQGGPADLVAVASHDTASAVVGVPAETPTFAYVSCGTWSLVGLELPEPVLNRCAFEANIANELGIDATTRFLKNVMGLWVFNETLRGWRSQAKVISISEVVEAAARMPALTTVVDIDDPVFLTPGDMPARIAEAARRTHQPVPASCGEVARCIIDSLALAYRRVLRQVLEVAGEEVSVLHLVGGGIQNRLLCQLTADATGLPVVAGPVEATALGNVAVQARAVGAIAGGLSELRHLIRASTTLDYYTPQGDTATWEAAERRLG